MSITCQHCSNPRNIRFRVLDELERVLARVPRRFPHLMAAPMPRGNAERIVAEEHTQTDIDIYFKAVKSACRELEKLDYPIAFTATTAEDLRWVDVEYAPWHSVSLGPWADHPQARGRGRLLMPEVFCDIVALELSKWAEADDFFSREEARKSKAKNRSEWRYPDCGHPAQPIWSKELRLDPSWGTRRRRGER